MYCKSRNGKGATRAVKAASHAAWCHVFLPSQRPSDWTVGIDEGSHGIVGDQGGCVADAGSEAGSSAAPGGGAAAEWQPAAPGRRGTPGCWCSTPCNTPGLSAADPGSMQLRRRVT